MTVPDEIAIDTSVAVQFLRAPSLAPSWLRHVAGLHLPVPVVSELIFGDLKSVQHGRVSDNLRDLLTRSRVINADAAVAEIYAELRLALERAGTKIPMNDLWIAACCVAADLPLVSRDRHFQVVPRLSLLRP